MDDDADSNASLKETIAQQHRLECLKVAAGMDIHRHSCAGEVLIDAKAFHVFVAGEIKE